MKIQLPSRKDMMDGAAQVADEAKRVAADAADELGNKAMELGTEAGDSAKGFAEDASAAVKDFGKDFGKDAEKAARDFGKGVEKAARDFGKGVEKAAKDFRKDASRATADAAKHGETAARDFASDAGNAAEGLGKDARIAAEGLGAKAEQATKDVGAAAGDIGKDMAKGFHDATSATGQMLRDAAQGIMPKIRVPKQVTDVDLPETRRRFDGLLAAAASGALGLAGRLAKAGGRAILPSPTPIQRVGFAMPIVGVVIVAAGTGAVLAYAFDPVSGRARRARARDQISAGARRIGRHVGRTQRYLTSTVAGKVQQVRESRREIAAEAESRPRTDFDMAHTRTPEMAGVMSGATTGNGLG